MEKNENKKMDIVGKYYLANLPNFDETCSRLYLYIEERQTIIFYHFEQDSVLRVFQVAVMINYIYSIYNVYACDIPCRSDFEVKQIVKQLVLEMLNK